MEHLFVVSVVERRGAIDHFEDEDTERPPVGCEGLAFVDNDLRTDVIGCSHKGVCLLPWLQQFTQPIIRHLDIPIDIEQYILWLEIPVDIPQIMQIIQGKIDLRGIEFGPLLRKPLSFPQMREHFSTPNKIHNKKYLLLSLEGKLQGDEEGVLGFLEKNSLSPRFFQMLFLY